MNGITIKTNKEREIKVFSGWPVLLINIILLGLGIWVACVFDPSNPKTRECDLAAYGWQHY